MPLPSCPLTFVPQAQSAQSLVIAREKLCSHVDPYAIHGEAAQISLRISQRFERSVVAQGGVFIVLQLPRLEDVVQLRENKPLPYESILRTIALSAKFVDPGTRLRAATEYPIASLFMKGGHYSKSGNQLVASTVAEAIANSEQRAIGEVALQAKNQQEK